MLDFEKVKKYLIEALSEKEPNFSENEKLAIVTHWLSLAHHSTSTNHKYNEFFTQCVKSLQGKVCENESSYGQESFLPGFVFSNLNVPFPAPKNAKFSFIDLFAGIGGFRLALQELGGECVFSSEWDKFAQETYFTNYGELPFGDITKEEIKSFIPQHFDVLCAGFPCQAFSIAGKRAGFEDTRGSLFFDVATIIKRHQPKIVFLENVKGLKEHDNGKTFNTIIKTLEAMNYTVLYNILNSMDYGNVPQTRERMFIICFNNNSFFKKQINSFTFPDKVTLTKKIQDILDCKVAKHYHYERFPIYKILKDEIKNKNSVYQWRRIYVRENKSNVFPTLTANMGTGGHNVPLVLDRNDVIRKITPRECARIQGYPDEYILPKIGDCHLYKQFGNSITLPVVKSVAKEFIKILTEGK